MGRKLIVVQSSPATDYTDTLTQHNFALANLTGLYEDQCSIKNVIVESKQNLAWSVYFYSKDSGPSSNYTTDSFIGCVAFDAADGLQVAGANMYKYNGASSTVNAMVDDGIAYIDEDQTKEIHVALVNRDATAKVTGVTGYVKVKLVCEINR